MGDFETGKQALLTLLNETLPLNSLLDVEIAAVADAQILIYNASGVNWENKTLSGDAIIDNAGVITIGTGKITSDKILNDTILNADINTGAAIAQSKLALSITTSEIDATTLVTAADTIPSNDNDTTIPTSAAVKSYVDLVAAAQNELGELTDVTITTPADNELLAFNGAGLWINQTPDEADLIDKTTAQIMTNKTLDDFSNNVHAQTLHAQVRNQSGGTLTKGQVVAVTGFHVGSNLPQVDLADADNIAAFPAIGIVSSDILNNAAGDVTISGTLDTIDTSSFSVGDTLFVSITPGVLTNVRPTLTAQIQNMGTVFRSNAGAGVIEVSSMNRGNALPNIPDGQIWIGNASALPVGITMSGDITISNTGVTAIGSGVILNADINSGADIAFSKLEALTSANILVGNVSNDAASVAMSGDILIDNAGVTSINTGVIVDGDIAVHTSTKITINAKGQLNSNILYGDQNNTIGAFYVDINDIAVPANPGAGIRRLFVNTATGELSVKTTGGVTVSLEAAGGGGESNTHSSLGGGSFALTAATPKTGVNLNLISISNGDGMNAALATDVLTLAVAATVVQTDQANTYGDFAQIFKDNQLFIENPAGTFEYQFIGGAIAADRTISLPVLAANDTFAFIAHDQFWSGIQTFEDNSIEISNPANTFQYLIQSGAIAADRTLNLPVLTGADTIAVLGLAQTFTEIITMGANIAMGTNNITGIKGTQFVQETVTYNATQVFDLDDNQYQEITLTGVLSTLSTSNRGEGKLKTIRIIGDSVDRVLTFNASWKSNPGDATVTVAANTRGYLSLYCGGSAESDVDAVYAEFA